jgi:hypothetical protein
MPVTTKDRVLDMLADLRDSTMLISLFILGAFFMLGALVALFAAVSLIINPIVGVLFIVAFLAWLIYKWIR